MKRILPQTSQATVPDILTMLTSIYRTKISGPLFRTSYLHLRCRLYPRVFIIYSSRALVDRWLARNVPLSRWNGTFSPLGKRDGRGVCIQSRCDDLVSKSVYLEEEILTDIFR
jgi:hypothetical protein